MRGVCERCGDPFEKKVHNKRFCSSLCVQADYRDRNRERINQGWRDRYKVDGYAKHIARKYGITLEEWADLSKDGCEVCGTMEHLVVDHCHETGRVRGALCVPHNAGIGSFHDSIEEMEKGIAYLRRVAIE